MDRHTTPPCTAKNSAAFWGWAITALTVPASRPPVAIKLQVWQPSVERNRPWDEAASTVGAPAFRTARLYHWIPGAGVPQAAKVRPASKLAKAPLSVTAATPESGDAWSSRTRLAAAVSLAIAWVQVAPSSRLRNRPELVPARRLSGLPAALLSMAVRAVTLPLPGAATSVQERPDSDDPQTPGGGAPKPTRAGPGRAAVSSRFGGPVVPAPPAGRRCA